MLSLLLSLCFFLTQAHAETGSPVLVITPTLVSESEDPQSSLDKKTGAARQFIEGRGSEVHIVYSAKRPFDLYIVPLHSDETYNPIDLVHAVLPAAAKQEAVIDVSVSPSWTLLRDKYFFLFVSTHEDTTAAIYETTFTGPTPGKLVSILWHHFWIPDPYLPSSYHILRGYRVLNAYVSTLLGIGTVIIMCIVLWNVRRKPEAGLSFGLSILLCATLLYSVRLSVDLLRYTQEHLYEWNTTGMYDEARDVYAIAGDLVHRSKETDGMQVYICRDGTNYREKIIRYFAYPVPAFSTNVEAHHPTHVLVMDRKEWNFEEGMLTCGDIHANAQKLTSYTDGSSLFAL